VNLLLVDDEPRVVEGLQRMLEFELEDADVRVACSGADALAALTQQPADIVLTDMRMPGMDGAELLAAVQARWPRTVRAVLSGQMDQSAAARALAFAHLVLSKPCPVPALLAAVGRARRLVPLLADAEGLLALGGLASPGPLPVLGGLSSEPLDASLILDALVAPVRADGDLAAAVVRLAAVPVEGEGALAAALHRVGLHGLRALALRQAWVNRGVAALQGGEDEACRLARRCQRLWEDDPQALVVGLFADLGEVLGGDRRAAQALGLWGLTAAVVEAVLHQSDPGSAPPEVAPLAAALHFARDPDSTRPLPVSAATLQRWRAALREP
jgi:CheY-like chemotaxis protein